MACVMGPVRSHQRLTREGFQAAEKGLFLIQGPEENPSGLKGHVDFAALHAMTLRAPADEFFRSLSNRPFARACNR
jgi:hypothetical protein